MNKPIKKVTFKPQTVEILKAKGTANALVAAFEAYKIVESDSVIFFYRFAEQKEKELPRRNPGVRSSIPRVKFYNATQEVQ